jgi:hypothetical protein
VEAFFCLIEDKQIHMTVAKGLAMIVFVMVIVVFVSGYD